MSSDDLKAALLAVTVTAWLLPIAVLAVATLVLRTRLKKPFAFLVLGALCCYGVMWVVGQIGWSRLLNLVPTISENALAATLLSTVSVVVSVSSLLSIIPVTWLYRVLEKRDSQIAQTPNTSLERTREG